MDTILWLIVGLAAGVVAMIVVFRTLPRTPWGWLGALAAGLIGGWLGGFITDLIGLEAVNWIGAFVIAFLGALALLLVAQRSLPAGHRH